MQRAAGFLELNLVAGVLSRVRGDRDQRWLPAAGGPVLSAERGKSLSWRRWHWSRSGWPGFRKRCVRGLERAGRQGV